MSQDVFLFDSTIYDNIAYGCPDATREQIERHRSLPTFPIILRRFPKGMTLLSGSAVSDCPADRSEDSDRAGVFKKSADTDT